MCMLTHTHTRTCRKRENPLQQENGARQERELEASDLSGSHHPEV